MKPKYKSFISLIHIMDIGESPTNCTTTRKRRKGLCKNTVLKLILGKEDLGNLEIRILLICE